MNVKTDTRTSKRAKRRRELVAAMLRNSNIQKAAAAAGMSEVTAWRIRKTPEFEVEYSAAVHDAYSQANQRLQYGSLNAVSLLLITLADANCPPATRVQAASRVLDHAKNAFLLQTLEKRVLQLEQGMPSR
jgi:hypothetical protein